MEKGPDSPASFGNLLAAGKGCHGTTAEGQAGFLLPQGR